MRWSERPVNAPAAVEVIREDRYWYPHDGGIVWLAGYTPVDPDGRYLPRDAPDLTARGLRIVSVAGARRHHGQALDSDALAPGRPLVLRRDPGNPHDPSAVALDTPAGDQAGWVPREVAAELAGELDAGVAWSAVVLREQRDSPRDPRTGVTALLARAPAVDLRERHRGTRATFAPPAGPRPRARGRRRPA
jgi:hypothetical protein